MIDDPVLLNDWHIVAKARDLMEGEMLTARLWDEELVLWRDEGAVMVWKDYCIHRGAKLSPGRIEDRKVTCPYHGWHYDAKGRCSLIPAHPNTQPPAKAKAIAYQATESDGFIWASLGNPPHEPPRFPEYPDDSYRKIRAGPYNYHGNPFRTVENFLDVAHFPFVHANINGDPNDPEPIGDYEVSKDEGGISTGPIPRFQPFGDHRSIPVTAHYQYKCPRPLSAYFQKIPVKATAFAPLWQYPLLILTTVSYGSRSLPIMASTCRSHKSSSAKTLSTIRTSQSSRANGHTCYRST